MAVSPHLARLASRGRPAGSTAAEEARSYCATILGNAGFVVDEQRFEYSIVAGAWGTPVGGVVGALGGIGLYLGRRSPALSAASILMLAATGLILRYLSGRGMLELHAWRRPGVNLQACRPGLSPTIWLVAHIDSKWQPVSMLARIAGVVVLTVGLSGLFVAVVTRVSGHEGLAAGLLLMTWLGASPLMLSIVGSKNDGALDNASGLAAVLQAAEEIPRTVPVGVLITDAEELGLAGARAWVRGRAPGVAINCDSIDDVGMLTIMYSGAAPSALIARLRHAAFGIGERVRVIRLIPGILTDHVPLARAGWQTLTLSRGDLRTLRRVHTARDTLEFMDGVGVSGAARVLALSATELG